MRAPGVSEVLVIQNMTIRSLCKVAVIVTSNDMSNDMPFWLRTRALSSKLLDKATILQRKSHRDFQPHSPRYGARRRTFAARATFAGSLREADSPRRERPFLEF